MKRNRIIKPCLRDGCPNHLEIPPCRLETAKYCSQHCKGLHKSMLKYGIKQELPEAKTIVWSKRLAYVIGIIATDGTLRKNRNSFKIGMKDKSVIEFIRHVIKEEVTGRENAIITETKVISEKKYVLYSYSFTSPLFFQFCLDVGLMPNKSLCLGELNIPKEFFPYFLLAVIDGDGNFNTLKRKLKSKTVEHKHVRIFSGSDEFLFWLNNQVSKVFQIESGTIVNDTGNRRNPKFTLFWSNKEAVQGILKGIYQDGFYVLERKFEQVRQLV